MKIFKLSIRFYVCQIVMSITTLVLLPVLASQVQNKPIVFSLVTSLLYFFVMYSAAWGAGKSDSRKIPGYYPDRKLPIWLSLSTAIVPVILLAIRLILPDIWKINFPFMDGSYDFFIKGCRVYGTPDMIYRMWFFPFAAFVPGGNIAAYIIELFVLPIIIVAGYNVGLIRFSILELFYSKVVYANPKKRDKARK